MSANSCPISIDNTAAPATESLCWSTGSFANLQIAISGIAGGAIYDVVANPGNVIIGTFNADGLQAFNVVPYNRVCLVVNTSGTGTSSVNAYLYNPVQSSSNGCSLGFDNTLTPPTTVNCWDTQNKNTLTLTFSGIAGGAEFEVRGSPGDIVIDTVTADGDYTYNVTPYANVCVVLTVSGTGTTTIDGYTYEVLGSGISHASLLDLGPPADDHPQYLHLPGRAGGQTAFGGTGPGEILRLQGSDDPALGTLDLVAPVNLDWDFTVSGVNTGIRWNNIIPASGGAVVAMLRNTSNITVDNALFISAAVYDVSITEHIVNPGFAVATLFLAQPTYKTSTPGINPTQSFILAAQPQFQNDGAGAGRTVSSFYAVSVAGMIRCTTAGDVLTVTNYTGMNVGPIWSTVAGSTVDFGTIRGIHMRNPVKGLFSPGAGIERMTAYIGLDMDNITFGDTGDIKAAVRSAMTPATNRYFLLNNGNASSDHGAGHIYFDDNAGIAYGGLGVPAFDVWQTWNAAGYFRTYFNSGAPSALRWSNPALNRFLFDNDGGNTTGEYNFNCAKFSIGQAGAVGNQVGVFVANARTVGVPGGWADFLLTQAGNLDIDGNAMSDVSAWVINPVAITLSGGSIVEVAGLRVGMTTSGLGGARTSAIIQQGRRTLRGVDEWEALTPADLTIDVDDYAPATGNSMRQMWRLSTDDAGEVTITGIAVQQRFDTQDIVNVGDVDDIVLAHENASSAASNRFISPTGSDFVLHPGDSTKLWHDDTTDRWRILRGHGERSIHLSGDQFRKGATAPTDVTIGTTPTVPALLFDATNELASLYHSLPADFERIHSDVILRLQFSLSSVEVNLDTCDFTCDYTAPTLVTAEGIAKASTQVTGQFTAVTGRLAIGDIYEMDITFPNGDATNPLATAEGIAFEIHLTNVTGVADIHLLDGDFIYEARY